MTSRQLWLAESYTSARSALAVREFLAQDNSITASVNHVGWHQLVCCREQQLSGLGHLNERVVMEVSSAGSPPVDVLRLPCVPVVATTPARQSEAGLVFIRLSLLNSEWC